MKPLYKIVQYSANDKDIWNVDNASATSELIISVKNAGILNSVQTTSTTSGMRAYQCTKFVSIKLAL